MPIRTLAVLLFLAGCGGTAPTPTDAGATSDAAATRDAGMLIDAAQPATDGAATTPDAFTPTPEVCDNMTDDDGDTLADCADDDCWQTPACAAAHVATLGGVLTACHDPIERSVSDEDAACALVGTPTGSMVPTVCAGEVDVTATVRFFCDDADAVRAVWILEHAVLPRSQTMLGPRSFEAIYYEHSYVLDFEHYMTGASGFGSNGTMPLHERSTPDGITLVNVRMVNPGSSVDRLLGLSRIDSLIDLDMAMSHDTRSTLRVGATSFAVP